MIDDIHKTPGLPEQVTRARDAAPSKNDKNEVSPLAGGFSSSIAEFANANELAQWAEPSRRPVNIPPNLERLRNRLLDLSARNRLLNFSYSRGKRFVRVVDELPDQLFEVLISGKPMRFEPVPEPTEQQLLDAGYLVHQSASGVVTEAKRLPNAEEWARTLGIKTDYELPAPDGFTAGRHEDLSIQALYFAPELESRLQVLYTESCSAIEETGANVLYLALGFLAWDESIAGKNSTRLAPLMLVPVRLERGELNAKTATYEYKLVCIDDEILTNLSLQEKLKSDFSIALPPIQPEMLPEAYFKAVADKVLAIKPAWQLHRFASLGLFEFGKLMMYLDLDPNRWSGESIADHPLVKQLTGAVVTTADDDAARGFTSEYKIDALLEVEKRYPLIDDADSSQHSAIIDVLNGDNLVIEGPPGTGKSQTITNVIAAAIAAGKKVLFVAEKSAALEVVKRRLTRAGLGDFCLEMHSHKSQKQAVIERIGQRIRRRGTFSAPALLDGKIAQLLQHKAKLNRYVEQLHAPYQETGLSAHQVLNRARRFREALAMPAEPFHPRGEVLLNEARVQDEAEFYAKLFAKTAAFSGEGNSLESHPWFGLQGERLDNEARVGVQQRLVVAQSAMFSLQTTAMALADQTQYIALAQASLRQIGTLADKLMALQRVKGDEDWSLLAKLDAEGCEVLVGWLNRMDALRTEHEQLGQHVQQGVLESAALRQEVEQAIGAVRRHSDNEHLLLEDLQSALEKTQTCLANSAAIQRLFDPIKASLPIERTGLWLANAEGLSQLALLLQLANGLPQEHYALRHMRFDDALLDPLLVELNQKIERLANERSQVGRLLSVDRLPSAEQLEDMARVLADTSFFCWFKGAWRKARKDLLQLARPGVAFHEALAALTAAEQWQRDYQGFLSNGRYLAALGDLFQGLDTPVDHFMAVRDWYRTLREQCGRGFGPAVWIADWLLGAPAERLNEVREAATTIVPLVQHVESVRLLLEQQFRFDQHELRSGDLLAQDGIFARLLADLKPALAVLSLQTRFVKPTVGDCTKICRAVAGWQDKRRHLEDDEKLRASLGGVTLPAIFASSGESVLASWRHTASLLQPLLALPDAPFWLGQLLIAGPRAADSSIARWLECGQRLSAQLARWSGAWASFVQQGGIDEAAWVRVLPASRPQDYLVRLKHAADRADLLEHWLEYRRLRGRLVRLGFAAVVDAIEQGKLDSSQCRTACMAGLLDSWARQLLEQQPELSQFSGKEQDAVRSRFAEIDHELKRLQCEQIAWTIDQHKVPEGVNSGRVKERTELALLEHEITKQRRHEPIRVLISRAQGALQALMPCFMMSPMAVAQYLPAGKVKFDLVIMDEASQVRAEEALGSFARGKQVVVVGDPKQLPPTNFFARQGSDEIEEDQDLSMAQSAESILDAAMPLFKLRRLRWHYRSRHESLIAFSNHAFYDDNLVIYPSPHQESVEFGVKFVRVPSGRFIEQRNIEEAQTVARAVEHHILHSPNESLGVVTMNIKQKEQIERMLEERSKENFTLREALERNRATGEPLFIKNLENVQGDERDVIYISFTYGPMEVGGRVPQRFGPINGADGWRRLNVLFTRAKKRMHAFASFDATDLLLTGTATKGVRALRDFLDFAETGRMPRQAETARAPDSDFEVAVIDMLALHGYECEPQVGVAGFFIDLAVRDPLKPGRYLMGIECDGASYHSAKSARDRDRLRQSILEQLGWKIRRIWSVDWYRNARSQIEPILAELNQLKSQAPSELNVQTLMVDTVVAEQTDCSDHLVECSRNVGQGSLREQLEVFNRTIIHPRYPTTKVEACLLRPAMLEALVELKPATKWEFVERIPGYLRAGTELAEEQFLDEVLALISQSQCQLVEE
ncbi:DUF4011 domain-containing anti-phage protein Hhe [Chitinimonas sp. BJB300]|uniref:DUF4011 domain-containing anti-phage protein Hhe n=1 Tax=Chitinimonas sp. BJB300 TaxID=1559339 RepID=UPI000C0D3FBF|nr:DUF4011 domain-containing anti-phage protein Hhe [Chitinimonas sp. BJB300]PHV13518.1 hypothetical protein CSQ89_00345 [Chitinimonas sp. BJB300]TSJ89798.1 DUF4011 domain-containing protein [Chitinimonas sp. BJB300]